MAIAIPMDNLEYSKYLEEKRQYKLDHRRLTLFARVTSLVTVMVMVALILNEPIFASALTDFMQGAGFQASLESVSKFDILGKLLSIFITAASIASIVGLFANIIIDYSYLTLKPLFDTIYDYQTEDASQGFLGLKGLVMNVFNAKRGVGMNALIGIAASIAPNVKYWSSFNPERMRAGLTGDESILSYSIKMAPTFLTAFVIFNLAYGGTLAKAYAVAAETVTVVADNIVEVEFAAAADKWTTAGQGYEFTIGNSNTNEAIFAEKIAKKMYVSIIKASQIKEGTDKQALGLNIERFVYDKLLGGHNDATGANSAINGHLKKLLGANENTLTSDDIKGLKFDVTINANDKVLPGEIGWTSSNSKSLIVSDFMTDTSIAANPTNPLYIHVTVTRGKKTSTEFFKPAVEATGGL